VRAAGAQSREAVILDITPEERQKYERRFEEATEASGKSDSISVLATKKYIERTRLPVGKLKRCGAWS
jgi:hypothetical protein